MMRSESSNYKLGPLDKVLVLKFVLKPLTPDTEFKMVCDRTIKISVSFRLKHLDLDSMTKLDSGMRRIVIKIHNSRLKSSLR